MISSLLSGESAEQSTDSSRMDEIQSLVAVKFSPPNKLVSATSVIEFGNASFTQHFKLIPPSNMLSVGFFLVNVSISKMPKLYTSPLIETIPFDPYSTIKFKVIHSKERKQNYPDTYHKT